LSGLIELWTGHTACALQAAMRLSNEAFAAHLGIAVRTVATLHQKPDLTPRAEVSTTPRHRARHSPARRTHPLHRPHHHACVAG